MDGLHPHSNLKGIVVKGFGGKSLSSWLFDMNNLKTVYLRSCYGCEQLPALGQLGSLETIRIMEMGSLEVIGIEFYEGRATTSSNSHKNSEMSRRRILFPRLKHLRLQSMEKLRDWVEPSGSIYEVFPCLEKLEIQDCPLLISAPTCFQSLLSLSISRMKSGEAVMMILTNTSNLTHLDISGVEQLTSLSHPLLKCSHSLKNLNISDCKELGELSRSTFQHMASLETLGVSYCDGLVVVDVEGLSSLRTLSISDCPSVGSIQHLPKCLKELALQGWPKLNSLPSELQYLNQLEQLFISGFEGIERLPEWLGSLSSLQRLYIKDCENLKYLPSLDAMRRLTQLRRLSIYNCPILREKCRKDGGEEWHKISHIRDPWLPDFPHPD